MNKRALIRNIIAHLAGELDSYAKAARAAHAEATHEQSKAENKYDTRGLEASYLAHGQSRQAAETEQALEQFEKLAVRDFSEADPIEVGALVELECRKERSLYFLGPRAGGTEITHEDRPVVVMTPQSPLGQQLMGKKQGDRFKLALGDARDVCRVLAVL
jgi:hypothetical protein